MTLLIDADYLAYKTCAACEDEIDYGDDLIVVTSRFSEVLKSFQNEVSSIADCLGSFDDLILFFSSPRNFRKKIFPDYKGHRNRKKPCGYKRLLNWCGDNYTTMVVDDIEADDAIGIYATDPIESNAFPVRPARTFCRRWECCSPIGRRRYTIRIQCKY